MQNVAEVEPTAQVEPTATNSVEAKVAPGDADEDLPAAPTHAVEEDSEVADDATLVPA